MSLEVGIVFDYINEIHYAAMPAEMDLKVDDQLIVKTIRSKEVGKVVHVRTSAKSEESNPFLKKILRLATEKDLERELQNRTREDKAMSIAAKKIDNLKLDMTLIRVHYLFDHSRILFYFKAAGKVDFRNLVRELASVFKARIELRQIGVRDEAKMLGGIATCGRPLCCSSWLRSFAPVTVRMAKEQHLSLNPTKISGLCGRLQCCLEYEQEFYETAQKNLPSDGSQVTSSKGDGKLLKANILKSEATILLSDGTTVTVPIDEISGQKRRKCHSSDKCESQKTCGGCNSDSRHSRRKKSPNRQRQENRSDKKSSSVQDKRSAESEKSEAPSYENSVKVAESHPSKEHKSQNTSDEKRASSSTDKQVENAAEKNNRKPFKNRRNKRRRKPRDHSQDKGSTPENSQAKKSEQQSDGPTTGPSKESTRDNTDHHPKEKNNARPSRRNRRRSRDRKKTGKSGNTPEKSSSENTNHKKKSGDNS